MTLDALAHHGNYRMRLQDYSRRFNAQAHFQGTDRRKHPMGRRWSDIIVSVSHGRADRVIQYGPFTIDDRCKRILFHDVPLEITCKEYCLLVLLIGNSGGTVSPDQITHFLWPDTPERFTEAKLYEVKQFVYTLRKKLTAHTGNPSWIKTVRGFGYMFTDLNK